MSFHFAGGYYSMTDDEVTLFYYILADDEKIRARIEEAKAKINIPKEKK